MEDVEKELKAVRGNIKGQLTRFKTFLNSYTPDKIDELNTRLAKCEELWYRFDDVQTKLEIINEAYCSERGSFEDRYFEVTSFCKRLISEHNVRCTDENERLAPSRSPQSNDINGVKLPTIELPQFSGVYDQWVTFCDTFRSLIHSNNSLSNIQKLHYLKSCLKGEAADMLQSVEVSDSNYVIAWDLLRDRYENKRLITHKHLKAIIELPCLVKESVSDLRRLFDEVKKNLRALKSLGQPVDQWDTLLIFLISAKLDDVSKREWEKSILPKNEPTMENLFQFLSERCQLLEALQTNQRAAGSTSKQANARPGSHSSKFSGNKMNSSSTRSFVTSQGNTDGKTLACYFCKESHTLFRCPKFLDLSTKSRIQEAKKLNVCVNCLRAYHSVTECVSSGCRRCGKKHNTLLHEENSRQPKANNVSEQQQVISSSNQQMRAASTSQQSDDAQVTVSALHSLYNVSEVLLSTAMVYIFDKNNRRHECRVLLDSASQSNFISNRLCQILGLSKQKVDIPVVGINQSITNISYIVNATIHSKVNNFQLDTSFFVIDKISNKLPSVKIDIGEINIPTNIILADSSFNIPNEVDILIGASVFWDLLCVGQIRLNQKQPVLQKTKLGWIISGTIPKAIPNNTEHRNGSSSCHVSTVAIQEQLERFWFLEEDSLTNKILSKEEQECEDYFQITTERQCNGHFSVRLPLRENIEEIGDSYSTALHRFSLLENRLAKNSEFRTKYTEFMKEYEDMGHMSKASASVREDDRTIKYYLPHHGVYKNDSTTTKLRVVFDASSKSDTGTSLNDKLKVGPTIQNDLFSILIRFRRYEYVIAADIAKMYRMVYVHENERDLQRILWRSDKNEPIQEYRLNTVTYGTASAAYLAVRCLHQVGLENQGKFPEACQVILKDFYVDDLLSGADSIQEAKQLKQDLIYLLDQYGFKLRKWMSNNSEILEDMSEAEQTVTHFIAQDTTAKTLGLIWNSEADTLQYSVNISSPGCDRVTKRSILSLISQIFDPLGLVGPAIIQAKIIMQRLWQLGSQWDESIPSDLHSTWRHFCSQIQELNKVKIPRHIFCISRQVVQLHGFSDASELAYGACVYFRTTNARGEHFSNLLCAKSRVAPLKRVTLPRLELCGALLLSQLLNKIVTTMDVETSKVLYYTDSKIVLAWIATESYKLKTFVANRTAEIQRLTNVNDWRHISGKDNPADIISRGMSPDVLAKCTLWWHGPSWLVTDEPLWPDCIPVHILDDLPETKMVQSFKVNVDDSIFQRYSTLQKLQRVTAYCLRFKNNTLNDKTSRITGLLTVEELSYALRTLIKLAQLQEFSEDIKALRRSNSVKSSSRLICLNPFIDKDDLIRIGGRLRNADMSYDNKHPILLPNKHSLTKLIVKHEHLRQLHAGPKALLAFIRLKYWPIAGRNEVRNVYRECVICRRARPTSYEYVMGNLPTERITPTRPFNICGIDYAGPFDIRSTKLKNYKVLKSYMCMFVCFVTKATHIELVSDLSTETFLNALKRFIARRGRCSHIYSDNGTNFVGAKNALHEVSEFLNDTKNQTVISEYLSQDSITWHMIPPRAPHFGGLWESAIKSAKTHIRKIIGSVILTFEELYTLMTQVESVLNSRPLTPLTQNPDDFNILTPGHFLIGDSMAAIPQPDLQYLNPNRLSRYQHLMQMSQHFWKRWKREYLSNLQQRNKWRTGCKTFPKPGTMVIIMDEDLPPLKWNIGRIEEVFPGNDDVIRVASVKSAKGVFKRPVKKLCPLLFDDD